MVHGSPFLLLLPSIFLRTPRAYGEARHFFRSRINHVLGSGNCCQLGRDIVPPRCETSSFFQGILAYIYILSNSDSESLREKRIDLSSWELFRNEGCKQFWNEQMFRAEFKERFHARDRSHLRKWDIHWERFWNDRRGSCGIRIFRDRRELSVSRRGPIVIDRGFLRRTFHSVKYLNCEERDKNWISKLRRGSMESCKISCSYKVGFVIQIYLPPSTYASHRYNKRTHCSTIDLIFGLNEENDSSVSEFSHSVRISQRDAFSRDQTKSRYPLVV